jgi:CTP:molybdopterin cytidylyltransferase MocA
MMKMPESGKLATVLLAAGPSTRLGQAKQLVQIDGESLVKRAVRLLQTLEPVSATIVTGCGSESVEQEIRDFPVEIAYNQNWARGMGASISCGMRNVTGNVDGILLMVCDQWRLEAGDLSRLVSTWKSDISQIYSACWKEGKAFVSGPPVLFPRNLLQELKYLHVDRGARQVIDRNMDIVEFVEMENAAFDVDRPEDLERLRNHS